MEINKTQEQRGSLSPFIHLILILYIVRHAIQIFTNLVSASIVADGAIYYNIGVSVALIVILILIMCKSRIALFAFFVLQLANAIVISVIDGDWGIHFFAAAVSCGILSAILCIRNEGKSAWKVLLASEKSGKKEAPTPTVTEMPPAATIADVTPVPPTTYQEQEKTIIKADTDNDMHTEPEAPKKKKTGKYLYFLAFGVLVAIFWLLLSNLWKSNHDAQPAAPLQVKEEPKPASTTDEYVYMDKANVLHASIDCKAVYKDHNSQAVTPFLIKEVTKGQLKNVCSQCVSEAILDSLIKNSNRHSNIDSSRFTLTKSNKRKLYDALSETYEVGSFKHFSKYLEDPSKRRALYNEIKEEYDLPDFDEFSRQLGFGESQPMKEGADVIIERLYKNLTADGYKLGSIDDFRKAMADSTMAARFHKNLTEDGYQLGSRNEFFAKIGLRIDR